VNAASMRIGILGATLCLAAELVSCRSEYVPVTKAVREQAAVAPVPPSPPSTGKSGAMSPGAVSRIESLPLAPPEPAQPNSTWLESTENLSAPSRRLRTASAKP
jgi:hypothetical protein